MYFDIKQEEPYDWRRGIAPLTDANVKRRIDDRNANE